MSQEQQEQPSSSAEQMRQLARVFRGIEEAFRQGQAKAARQQAQQEHDSESAPA